MSAQAAREGIERARRLKPDPFFTPDSVERIQTGGFDSDLQLVAEADWIIEAIIEQPDAKRSLLERVDAVRRKGSIVSSNTSGLSIAALSRNRSDDFKRHWLGTHFFNPPRYLPLLELIPTDDTDPAVIATSSAISSIAVWARTSSRKTRWIHRKPWLHGLVAFQRSPR
jgi:3-hydroxyacyl-CoA dehydrogenase